MLIQVMNYISYITRPKFSSLNMSTLTSLQRTNVSALPQKDERINYLPIAAVEAAKVPEVSS
jgi:hypothetical protein